MLQNFYFSFFGIMRDENYTYYADGTKERSNESTAVWDGQYNSKTPCAGASPDFVLWSLDCRVWRGYGPYSTGVCEKSVCIN